MAIWARHSLLARILLGSTHPGSPRLRRHVLDPHLNPSATAASLVNFVGMSDRRPRFSRRGVLNDLLALIVARNLTQRLELGSKSP